MRETFESINIDFSKGPAKVFGYKTLRGLIGQLKRINKNYKKMGISGKFTIQLPIKS